MASLSEVASPFPKTIVDFQLPSPPTTLRVRPAAHLADPAYIAKFDKAIELMKALPDSDPRNFRQQANLYSAYLEGAYEQAGLPNPEVHVHNSSLFLPWHRMYLYFFERILAKLASDENISVPFWNWDAQGGKSIPARYADRTPPFYDTLGVAAHQPPPTFVHDYSATDSNIPNSNQLSQNLTIMYRQMVLNSKTPGMFFGSLNRAGDEPDPGRGSVENIFPGGVHIWDADRSYPYSEDMGNFYSAGRDVMFFGHHANVDRMWSVWQNTLGHENFNDSEWLTAAFYFYDENKQIVYARVGDFLDTSKLGYECSSVVDIPWLNARPKPRLSKAERQLVKLAVENAADSHSPQDIFPAKLDKVVKVMVKRPHKNRSKEEKDEKDEILAIQNIVLDRDKFAKFDVFINDEENPRSTPENTEFAGSFVNAPHKHKHGEKIKTHLTLSLTEILEDMEAEDDEDVLVTLVPRAGCDDVTVGGIKIELDSSRI